MKRFLANFKPDAPAKSTPPTDSLRSIEPLASGITSALTELGGSSFRGGLYRIHRADAVRLWTGIICAAFPHYAGRILCFGYDWLGRHFALDRARVSEGQAEVVLLDLGFNEALEIPASFVGFHDTELVDHASDALAEPFFDRWISSGGARPTVSQCVGYRVPPVLGGKDQVDNLELTDMEVYWGVIGQIVAKIKDKTA